MTLFLLSDTSAAEGTAGALILIFLTLLFGVVGLFLWILPGLIANSRKHHNRGAIWAVTLLLGWSFIGWLAALVWAFTNPPPPQVVLQNPKHLE